MNGNRRSVAQRLQPYLRELRPFARDARPTVRDLSALVRSPGKDNDLLELQRTYPALADITLETKRRSMDGLRSSPPASVGVLCDLRVLCGRIVFASSWQIVTNIMRTP